MVGDLQNVAPHGDGSPFPAAASCDPPVSRPQVGGFASTRCLARLRERLTEKLVALPGVGLAPFASTLVAPWTHPAPGDQMVGV